MTAEKTIPALSRIRFHALRDSDRGKTGNPFLLRFLQRWSSSPGAGISKAGVSLFSKSKLIAAVAFDRVTHSQRPSCPPRSAEGLRAGWPLAMDNPNSESNMNIKKAPGCNLTLLKKCPDNGVHLISAAYREGNVNYHYDSYQCNRERSYSWLRNPLPRGSIAKAVIQDTHRVHRERAPPLKITPHQHGSNHCGILFIRLPQDR